MLDMTIGILTLYGENCVFKNHAKYSTRKLVHKSEAERIVEMSDLRQAVGAWKLETELIRKRVLEDMKAVDDTEESGVIDELNEEEGVLREFMEHSSQTAEQLQALMLNQTISSIKSDEDSKVKLGMPASVVDKVARQTITDVTSTKSKVTVGI